VSLQPIPELSGHHTPHQGEIRHDATDDEDNDAPTEAAGDAPAEAAVEAAGEAAAEAAAEAAVEATVEATETDAPAPRRSGRVARGMPPLRYAPYAQMVRALAGTDFPFEAPDGSNVLTDLCMHSADCAVSGKHNPPLNLEAALNGPDRDKWLGACREELAAMFAKQVYECVQRPHGVRCVKCMWVFSCKLREDGSIERYKARLVAKGFTQRYGIDYTQVWEPTGKIGTLRALLALAAEQDLDVIQVDIKTAFLNAELEEDIYMEQPEAFGDGTHRVWRLRRALYGLKQAARQWHQKLRDQLSKIGYTSSSADPALFIGTGRAGLYTRT
jgi:hypothetical protein